MNIAAPGSARDEFESRCRSLRLLPWQFDLDAVITHAPNLGATLDRFFLSPGFVRAITRAAKQALEKKLDAPLELAPGLWGIPVPLQKSGRLTGLSIVVGIEASFCTSHEAERLSLESRLPSEQIRILLAPLVRNMRHTTADLAHTLRWMREDLTAAHVARQTMDQFSENLAQSYEQVNFVFRLAGYLNVVKEPVEMIHLLLAQAREILSFAWVAVRFLPQHTFIRDAANGLLLHGDTDHYEEIDAAAVAILKNASGDDWTKILTPANSPVAAACKAEILADPIYHDDKIIGVLLVGNKQGHDTDLASTDIQLLDAIANFFGVFHENIARFSEQRSLFLGILHALTSAIDAKDHYTRGHSERVALLAGQMAKAMKLPEKIVEQYRIAGLVHDVGKIGVPEAVLRKPARLTDEEFAEIKKHPRLGYEILKGILPLEAVLPGVLHHHERWDGRGYPDGIAGENIARIARVLALADTFDAMSSHRAYRTSRPRDVVFAEIRRNAGLQFDPNLVELFLALDFTDFDHHLACHSSPLAPP